VAEGSGAGVSVGKVVAVRTWVAVGSGVSVGGSGVIVAVSVGGGTSVGVRVNKAGSGVWVGGGLGVLVDVAVGVGTWARKLGPQANETKASIDKIDKRWIRENFMVVSPSLSNSCSHKVKEELYQRQ
jgi:hypothetical protein